MISAIIIEMFDQEELLKIMKLAITQGSSFVRKIRIFLVFLEGCQWVKMRQVSRYNINLILS
jgi:hypothetical protein